MNNTDHLQHLVAITDSILRLDAERELWRAGHPAAASLIGAGVSAADMGAAIDKAEQGLLDGDDALKAMALSEGILWLVGKGEPYEDIAARLGMSMRRSRKTGEPLKSRRPVWEAARVARGMEQRARLFLSRVAMADAVAARMLGEIAEPPPGQGTSAE